MINIFFGSSLLNEQTDKDALEVFIRKLNVEFSTVNKLVDIHIKPLFKNELSIVDNLIKKAEYTFFILFKKVTIDEKDEIDIAVRSFEENNRPKVYVYFKLLDDDDTVEDSIIKLQEKISNEFAHYYKTFKNIDEIKLRLIENVFSDKLSDSLVVSDDTLKFEGIDLGKYIDYKIMPEFINNEELQNIKKEYDALLKEYNDAVNKDNDEDFFYLQTLYAKKEVLKEKLRDKEQKILSLSIKLIELKNKDLKNESIEKAVNLFEKGDMKGCIEALNLSRTNRLIREAYSLKDKAMFELDQAKNNIIWAIKERRIVIDILLATDNIENKDRMIEELFRENAQMALDFEVEYDEAFNFAEYLTKHAKFDEALEFTSMLEEVITEKSDRKYPILYAKLYNLFGLNSSLINKDDKEAISYYIDSLNYYKMLEDELGDDETYLYGLYKNNLDIADSTLKLNDKNCFEQASGYFEDAITICEKLCDLNFGKYCFDLSYIYTKYLLIPSVEINDKYEQFFLKLVEYSKSNFNGKNIERLADSLTQLGNYYLLHGSQFDALNYFEEAVSLYDSLTVISTNELRGKIGNTHNQITTIKQLQHDSKAAIYHQEKAKEYISIAFKENPLLITEYFTALFNLYMLYQDVFPAKAIKLIDECNNLIDRLNKTYPGRVDDIALYFYGNIFIALTESAQLDEANYYYKKFTKIFDGLKQRGLDYSSFHIFFGFYADIIFNFHLVQVDNIFSSLSSLIDVVEYVLSLGDKNANQFLTYLSTLTNLFSGIILELQAVFAEHPEYLETYKRFLNLSNETVIAGNKYAGNDNFNLPFDSIEDIDKLDINDAINKITDSFEEKVSFTCDNKLSDFETKISVYQSFLIWATSTGLIDKNKIKKYFDDAFDLIFECNALYPDVSLNESLTIFSTYINYIGVSRKNKEIVKKYIEYEISKFDDDLLHVSYTYIVITIFLKALEELYRIRDERENVVKYIGEIYKVLNRITIMSEGKINKKIEVSLLEFNIYVINDTRYFGQIVDILIDSIAESIDDDLKISFCKAMSGLIELLVENDDRSSLEKYLDKLLIVINPLIESVNDINYEDIVNLLFTMSDALDLFGVESANLFREKAHEIMEMYSDNNMDDLFDMFNL